MSDIKYELSDDKEAVSIVFEGLKKKKGYCPCELEVIEDTKCPCKKMREEQKCKCGLYKSKEDNHAT